MPCASKWLSGRMANIRPIPNASKRSHSAPGPHRQHNDADRSSTNQKLRPVSTGCDKRDDNFPVSERFNPHLSELRSRSPTSLAWYLTRMFRIIYWNRERAVGACVVVRHGLPSVACLSLGRFARQTTQGIKWDISHTGKFVRAFNCSQANGPFCTIWTMMWFCLSEYEKIVDRLLAITGFK
jgi:hypothetical protein